ncbi:MAG TPA: hypothetical protein VMV45_03030 [Casimicrobiaceae bacterium]|nr:hypothetical protein [Casimicrobiaceae bacterium]
MDRLQSCKATRSPATGEGDGTWLFLGAVGWLALGSGGLLFAIAFTADTTSLSRALLVWAVAFVVPSVLAALAAYRSDAPEGAPPRPTPVNRARPLHNRARKLWA